jgi:hypothetical protein
VSEAVREPGNALAADEDLRDVGEGVGVPHRVLRSEDHLLIGLPAKRALEPGRVRRFLGELRLLVLVGLQVRLFLPQGVDVGAPRGGSLSSSTVYLRSPEVRLSPVRPRAQKSILVHPVTSRPHPYQACPGDALDAARARDGRLIGRVRVTVVVRSIPGLPARCGTQVARPARTNVVRTCRQRFSSRGRARPVLGDYLPRGKPPEAARQPPSLSVPPRAWEVSTAREN